MTKQQRIYASKISRLEKLRQYLSRQLDRSYARGNMSDYIVLEGQYRNLARKISSLRTMLSAR
jgi:hypothetical protein